MVVDVFPRRLRAARLRAGMSKAAVAAAAGMKSRQVASRWEDGQRIPDPDTLVVLARALRTTVDYLLGTDVEQAVALPIQHIDLREAVGMDELPILWSGHPLSPSDRRRAYASLHALLAPLAALPVFAQAEGTVATVANHNRPGATTLANVARRRPKPAQQGDEHADAEQPGRRALPRRGMDDGADDHSS